MFHLLFQANFIIWVHKLCQGHKKKVVSCFMLCLILTSILSPESAVFSRHICRSPLCLFFVVVTTCGVSHIHPTKRFCHLEAVWSQQRRLCMSHQYKLTHLPLLMLLISVKLHLFVFPPSFGFWFDGSQIKAFHWLLRKWNCQHRQNWTWTD